MNIFFVDIVFHIQEWTLVKCGYVLFCFNFTMTKESVSYATVWTVFWGTVYMQEEDELGLLIPMFYII